MSALRPATRTLYGPAAEAAPDVAIGPDYQGRPRIVIQGGAHRSTVGLSFHRPENIRALRDALTEALAEIETTP